MGSLPMPPQVAPPQIGGGRGGGAPFILPTPGAQVAQGVDNFIQNYAAARRATEIHNREMFYDNLDKMTKGLWSPQAVDLKKMARMAQKAHLPLKFDATPEEQQNLFQSKVADTVAAQAMLQSPMGMAGTGNTPQLGVPMPGAGAVPVGGLPPGAAGFRSMPTPPTLVPGMPPPAPIGGVPASPELNAVLTAGLQGPNPDVYSPTTASLRRPNILRRIFQPSSRINMASPGIRSLQDLIAAGQGGPMSPSSIEAQNHINNLESAFQTAGYDLKNMNLQDEMAMRGRMRTLLNPDDPQYVPTMSWALSSGILPNIPQNTIADMVYRAGGNQSDVGRMLMFKEFGQPMFNMQMEMGRAFEKYFNHDAAASMQYARDIMTQGWSPLHPLRTPEEDAKVFEEAGDLIKNTNMPPNIAFSYAEARNNPALAPYEPMLRGLTGKFTTQQQFGQGQEFAEKRYVDMMRANTDVANMMINQNRLATDTITQARQGTNEQYNHLYDLMTAELKAGNRVAAQSYLQQMGALNYKGSTLKYNVTGPDGKPMSYTAIDPDGLMKNSLNWYQKQVSGQGPFGLFGPTPYLSGPQDTTQFPQPAQRVTPTGPPGTNLAPGQAMPPQQQPGAYNYPTQWTNEGIGLLNAYQWGHTTADSILNNPPPPVSPQQPVEQPQQ